MEDQGIMALPQAGMQAPTAQPQAAIDPKNFSPQVFDYAQMQPDQFGQDILGGMETTDPALVAQFKQALAGMRLPPEVIDALGQMVDAVLAEPEKYAEIRAAFIAEGVPEDILPPTFDAAYFAALNIALDQLSSQQAPVGMADGGIMSLSPVAAGMARMGRNGDRMLAHITPAEARMLRRRGGSGTINPVTGQREFFVKRLAKTVGSVFKAAGNAVTGLVKGVGKVVKKIASSDIGRIALTMAAVYFMGPAGLNFASGTLGVTNAALAMGVNTFAASTAVSLASGQNLKDSLRTGVASGVLAGVGTGFAKGFDATVPTGAPTGATTFDGIRQDPFIESDLVSGQAPPVSEGVVPQINTPTLQTTTNLANAPVDLTAGRAAIEAPVSGLGQPVTNVAAVQSPVVSDSGTLGLGPTPAPSPLNAIDQLDLATGQESTIMGPVTTPLAAPTTTPLSFTDTVKTAYNTVADPVKDFYGEYLRPYSPAGIREAGAIDAATASDAASQKYITNALRDTGYASVREMPVALQSEVLKGAQLASQSAATAATPGLFSQYAPVVGAGLGAAYLGGAFTPEEPGSPNLAPKETGTDLLRAQPGVYGTTPGGANITYGSLPSGYNYNPMQMLYRPQITMGNPYGNIYGQRRMFAEGGIASVAPRQYATGGYAKGGIGSMTSKFPRKTGPINGPGTGTSDDIPAMLSDGEFVMTAKAVRGAGKGSRREGARRMYAMMRKLEGKA